MLKRILLVVLVLSLFPLGVVSASKENTTPVATDLQSGCALDLMLVLDGSGSIAPDDFEIMKDFVRDLVAAFPVGPRDANIGIIQFSTTAALYLEMSDDRDRINAAVDNMTQFGESTNIAAAIDLAQAQFVTRRAGIPRVMIVLTDGMHNEAGNPIAQADIARAAGTAVFGVAVGQVDFNELIAISGGDENVFTVSGFNGLAVILDLLLNSTCAVLVVPQPGDEAFEVGEVIDEGTVQVEFAPPEVGDTLIAFASDRDGDFEIFTMNADGSNVTQLTFNSVRDDKPAWSKDGSRIAFESEVDGDFEIYVMNADGSNVQQITDNDWNDWGPAWSPDNSRLAFHSDQDGDVEIYVMNADGSNVQQITFNSGAVDRSPSWSPDGQEVIYYSDVSGGRELYRVNLTSGVSPLQLTVNDFYDGQPDWSLNGTGVVFGSTREDGNSEIYVMRTNGSNVVRLTTNPGTDDDPIWSPDGRQIAFESDSSGNFDIWIMNVDGTGMTRLTDNPATDWSPDWMWVAGALD